MLQLDTVVAGSQAVVEQGRLEPGCSGLRIKLRTLYHWTRFPAAGSTWVGANSRVLVYRPWKKYQCPKLYAVCVMSPQHISIHISHEYFSVPRSTWFLDWALRLRSDQAQVKLSRAQLGSVRLS